MPLIHVFNKQIPLTRVINLENTGGKIKKMQKKRQKNAFNPLHRNLKFNAS